MIPWLIVAQILCESGQTLSSLVGERIACFRSAANSTIASPTPRRPSRRSRRATRRRPAAVDRTDGVSFEFADWRFNLRSSNTEPLIRLNVEARGSVKLMQAKTEELLGAAEIAGRRRGGSLRPPHVRRFRS